MADRLEELRASIGRSSERTEDLQRWAVAEIERLRALNESLAERVAAQSELRTKRSEKQ